MTIDRFNAKPARTAVLSLAALLLAGVLLIASAGCDSKKLVRVDLSVTSYRTPADMQRGTDYLVTATIVGAPKSSVQSQLPVVRYWTADARVESVIAQRPEVSPRLAQGMIIPIRSGLLNASAAGDVSNYAELTTTFPSESDAPKVNDHVVAFLTIADLDEIGKSYFAMGEAVIDTAGNATVRAVPGPLNHQTFPLAALTTALAPLYATPREVGPPAASLSGPTAVPSSGTSSGIRSSVPSSSPAPSVSASPSGRSLTPTGQTSLTNTVSTRLPSGSPRVSSTSSP